MESHQKQSNISKVSKSLIMLEILQFVPEKDRFKLQNVSKRWYDYILPRSYQTFPRKYELFETMVFGSGSKFKNI